MPLASKSLSPSSARRLRACAQLRGHSAAPWTRPWSTFSPLHSSQSPADDPGKGEPDASQKKPGAMSRRLADMQDANIEEGGRGAKKAIEEAGFDDELKQELLDRIAGANFKNDNASAFAQVNMPSSAGQGTREQAAAQAWQGTESVHDVSLRMLDDSYKRLRTPASGRGPRGPPKKVDTGRVKQKPSSGARLANARDRSSIYAYLQDPSMTDKEREQYRNELKERFTPAARSVPVTLQGLASLANERIEDAIARGQFKNLPRGKPLERDYNMSSPFLDTTEYFMNKIIQKQDIVPPWIEKQQEVVSTATKFRSRLRADWRRHAARMISSAGGSVESQVRRAEAYAAAEAVVNPKRRKEEKLNAVDESGHLSQITLSGDLTTGAQAGSSEAVTQIKVTEEPVSAAAAAEAPTPQPSDAASDATGAATTPASTQAPSSPTDETTITAPAAPSETRTPLPSTPLIPFRDPQWEANEHAYHSLAIANLNSLTRSYNLMAPNLAKKPYFTLARELRAAYADVAPQLAGEIRERARAPARLKIEVVAHKPGGVLERFSADKAAVWDERRPQYGFRQFWRDLFTAKA